MPGSRPSSPCFLKGASAAFLLPPSSGVATASPPPRGQGGLGEVQQPFGWGLSRHSTSHTSTMLGYKISMYSSMLLWRLKSTHHHTLSSIRLLKISSCWHFSSENNCVTPTPNNKSSNRQEYPYSVTLLLPDLRYTLTP